MAFSLDPEIAKWLSGMKSGHRSKLVNLALGHMRETQSAVDAAQGLSETRSAEE